MIRAIIRPTGRWMQSLPWQGPSRLLVGGLALVALVIVACDAESGPSVEFGPAPDGAAYANAGAIDKEGSSPKLGFIPAEGKEPVAMANGSRIPLGNNRVAEVFLSPYPPDWNTGLHLFMLDGESFEPIENVDVDLDYGMVGMSHGSDPRSGTKIDDGHYLLPLSFVMYGDWSVDIRMAFPGEETKHLQIIVKFDP